MRLLARRLTAQGYVVSVQGYAGVRKNAKLVRASLQPAFAQADAVVAHSLGGLIALEMLRAQADFPVRRVVCLGSPLQGSRVARTLRDRNLTWVLGRSSELLMQGCALPGPTSVEVGMIAGSNARGIGRMMRSISTASDGTVDIQETRWGGLADHRVVAASHSGLLFSREAACQAASFLRRGQFLDSTRTDEEPRSARGG